MAGKGVDDVAGAGRGKTGVKDGKRLGGANVNLSLCTVLKRIAIPSQVTPTTSGGQKVCSRDWRKARRDRA